MSALAFWTWLAVGTLLVVPPVVFGLFLRDAFAVFEDLDGEERSPEGEGGAE